jgi:CelD/BcsL family acetyltransferase involved in cellulose biosynthesis
MSHSDGGFEMQLIQRKPEYPLIDGKLEVEIIDSLDKLESIADEWRDLVSRSPGMRVFQGYEWNRSSYLAGGQDRDLFIIIVREKGKGIGLAPLTVRRRYGVVEITPIGATNNVYFGLLIDQHRSDAIYAIAKVISDHFRSYLIHFPFYDAVDPSVILLQSALCNLGGKSADWTRNISHHIFDTRGYEEFIAEKSSKSRPKLRRKIRKLRDNFTVDIKLFTGSEMSAEVINRAADIQRSSWLFRRGVRLMDSPYYSKVLPELAKKGQAEIFLVTLDDKDSAFVMHYVFDRHRYQIATAFDENLAQYNVGEVMLNLVLEQIFESTDYYDFLFGDAEYKRFWGTRTNIIKRTVITKGIAPYLLSWLPHRLHGKLSRWKKMKNIYSNIRKILP